MHVIKNFSDYTIDKDGNVYSYKSNKYLKTRVDRGGYVTINIQDDSGRNRTKRIHRLIAEAFIPNPDNKPEVNHIDTNKQNNSINNLEWVTSKENKTHAYLNDLYPIGENHGNAVLKESIVITICEMLQEGVRNKDISEKLGVHKDVISHIKLGDVWKEISSRYNFNMARKQRKSIKTVEKVCILIIQGFSNTEISDILNNISNKEVGRIRNKKIYKCVSDLFF